MPNPQEQAGQGLLPQDSSGTRGHASNSPRESRRQATVYDAVAGRVSSQRFIPDQLYFPSTRDTTDNSTIPLPPDEVLFRSRPAPERYEEDDRYWGNRHLLPGQCLPESDLLKTLHTYVSGFYDRTFGEDAHISHESLDESALMALGIILEEACKNTLEDTGDLALIEGEEIDHNNRRGVQNLKVEEAEPCHGNRPSKAADTESFSEESKAPKQFRKRRRLK
ncbi:uncharacterized protein KY384_001903 [Bacidia gigantensis]|uniref:uncharacterized protein n=1 Tax=Bacidia gigantensis TaxID=2732470 RepID=UPI001D058CF1|nr:uncharacterized protein KY384_001903 [Bacidia gigantensis]KAG8533120.1 hypothetical protein KY384_001903 [Bacidia gigantensis]